MDIKMIGILDLQNVRTSIRNSQVWLVFLGILVCYFLLIIPTVDRLGIGWDEETDLEIAQTYMTPRGILLGSSRDPSQTRLPMFTGAVIFHLFGTSSLSVARFTTIFVGALTLLGIFEYGKKYFSPAIGLLAVGLLAINPFFLSFSRLAFTESDIYLACSLTWLLLSVAKLVEKPTIGWAIFSGVFASLSISSKATALILVPVVAASFVVSRKILDKKATPLDAKVLPSRTIWFWTGWAVMFMLAGILISRHLNAQASPSLFHLFNYGFVSLGWFLLLVWAVRHRRFSAPPLALAAWMTGFSVLTFIILPPEHLANSEIIDALITRAGQEMEMSTSFIFELAAFHSLTILLKSTPLLGFFLLAGFFSALTQWRRSVLILPLLVVAVYMAGLLLLPLGQTFYTIPLLPVLSLLAADQLVRWIPQRQKILLAFITVGLIWWGVEMRQCYPDYHLNGYQWVGARPLFGRSSIGYRSIVYTPSDGVQQSIEWLNHHAKAGQIAQLYVEPWHIVKATAPKPVYKIIDGRESTLSNHPDFIVIHIGSMVQQGEGNDAPLDAVFLDSFDRETLNRNYEKVFSVQRAFGLEMASIWKRK